MLDNLSSIVVLDLDSALEELVELSALEVLKDHVD